MEKWHALLYPASWQKPKRAPSNLQEYISKAILPSMAIASCAPQLPPQGHGAHRNHLTARPEIWRRLEVLHSIVPEYFDNVSKWYVGRYIPSNDLNVPDGDEVRGDQFTLRSEGFDVQERMIGYPGNMDRVVRWVVEFPLLTVERTLHLTFQQTLEWTFDTSMSDLDVDRELFRTVCWTRTQVGETTKDAECALMVFIQPPWIMTPYELKSFSDCPGLRIDTETYKGKERTWSKVWDYCFRKKCHWFIFTTYRGWVFGAFSRGWTRGFATPVFQYNSTSPNILEGLIFWISSAMGLADGWHIPECNEEDMAFALSIVAEPVTSHNLRSTIPAPPLHSFPPPPPSDTSWGEGSLGCLQDSLSENSLEDGNSETRLSPDGLLNNKMVLYPDPNALAPGTWRESISKWDGQANVLTTGEETPRAGSPLPQDPDDMDQSDDGSDDSTVVELPPTKNALGLWLTSNPIEMRFDDTYLE
ncbi:unnamed protein product [Somion occarium]|uniref:Aminotransferase-like plant mobile domain-containing protein n=1 Tax=Somion occarium TaxID=3059160 RepID=A0ABP1DC89_9APHY